MTINVSYLAQLVKVTDINQETTTLSENTSTQDSIQQPLCPKHSVFGDETPFRLSIAGG